MTVRDFLAKNYINAIGWRTNKKLVVIESDDWGATQMSSMDAIEKIRALNINIEANYFDRYDHLESDSDLLALYDVLSSVKDKNGNPAILTADSVVSNPNFEAIDANGRTSYVPESSVDSYQRFPNSANVHKLFMEGISHNLIFPQFHGREHIHVKNWLKALNSDNPKDKVAFQEKSILFSDAPGKPGCNYVAAFDYSDPMEVTEMREIILDGLQRFEQIFGYKSVSFVCPTSTLGIGINQIFSEAGVSFCQTGRQFWRMPDGSIKQKQYKWGQKENGITFWRRNCNFETSRNQHFDWVDSCLNEIAIAFLWGKPAVINSHRVNYMGSLCENNRAASLKKLKQLLQSIKKRWPDVEFIHSAQLGHIIAQDAK